jgi:hypothetical protein
MYFNKKEFKKEIRQIKDEQINLILEQPTATDVKQFDVYKIDNELFYSKEEVDNYLLKHIRNVFDTLGID